MSETSIKSEIIIELCINKITELKSSIEPKQKQIIQDLMDQERTKGMLWWKKTYHLSEDEAIKVANTPEDSAYPVWFPSPFDEINERINEKIKRVEEIKSVAVFALAYGQYEINLTNKEIERINSTTGN